MAAVYSIENGVRRVLPYFHQTKVYAKGRWLNQTVVDVLSKELSYSRERLKRDIHQEQLYVVRTSKDGTEEVLHKGWDQLLDLKLRNKDLVLYTQHRHEPNVPHDTGYFDDENCNHNSTFPSQCKTKMKIVYEDDEIMVIDKPSGIPCHPVRKYNHNTILGIIKNETGLDFLHNCHRLDKGTSGILILAKTKGAASKYPRIIEREKKYTTKQYLARVEGDFPENEFMIRCPVFALNTADGRILHSNNNILPTDTATVFKRVSYNKNLNQSIVMCTAVTGKMHQIRIHLRLTGHPIVNDLHYNNIRENNNVVLTLKNKIETAIYEILFAKYPHFKERLNVADATDNVVSTIDLQLETEFKIDPTITKLVDRLKQTKLQHLSSLKLNGDICEVCQQELVDDDLDLADQQIWLHSYQYSYVKDGDEIFNYKTALPSWCNI
ncbi:uncharacterized protein KQ657_003841 [Scheffersomyces spartinae]|uniref:Pseudouridine synthase RsuA/RluA-like domain-containing protein n=1 Tax=Scheffersomyces spartinae TaxID=45513 RepID=A0A9P8AJC7_9ASCO|nr:uncharacterized protein KQ657_003841 [Scheffersomyces spartinae]KAG7195313.1 hypothetical protein KQ657_003841 [Scheffersomyces spartinae]